MRQNALFTLCIILIMSQPVRAETVRLWPLSDTTPSHVYAVWVNINSLLASIGEQQDPGWRKRQSLNRSAGEKLPEITPRNVLGLVNEFRSILDKELTKQNKPLVSISQVSIGSSLKPHIVFMNSLQVLDSLTGWEEGKFGGVSSYPQYFSFEIPEGKIPSDVYTLVEQAIWKLEWLSNI
jgi:hypothetical protein